MKEDDKQRVNADNASHNLDSQVHDQGQRPSRDVSDADFAAEAHGFTAFENTGQGSTYPGGALDEGDNGSDTHIVRGPDTGRGPAGETLLAAGRHAALKIWPDHMMQDKSVRPREFETTGYVLKGEVTMVIGGEKIRLAEGDSFVISADTAYEYRDSRDATVLEAIAPPAVD